MSNNPYDIYECDLEFVKAVLQTVKEDYDYAYCHRDVFTLRELEKFITGDVFNMLSAIEPCVFLKCLNDSAEHANDLYIEWLEKNFNAECEIHPIKDCIDELDPSCEYVSQKYIFDHCGISNGTEYQIGLLDDLMDKYGWEKYMVLHDGENFYSRNGKPHILRKCKKMKGRKNTKTNGAAEEITREIYENTPAEAKLLFIYFKPFAEPIVYQRIYKEIFGLRFLEGMRDVSAYYAPRHTSFFGEDIFGYLEPGKSSFFRYSYCSGSAAGGVAFIDIEVILAKKGGDKS